MGVQVTAFKIRKNVPLPESRNSKPCAYPFDDMEIGDSFVVPLDGRDPVKLRARVSSSCVSWGKKHRARFVTRIVPGAGGGIGVWRVEPRKGVSAESIANSKRDRPAQL